MVNSSAVPPDLSALSPLAPALAATIARVASDIAIVIDPDGVIRSVAQSETGMASPGATWVGQRWVDTATDGTRRKIELLLQEVQTSGVTRRREVNHPSPSGSEIPMTWSAIRLGEGGPVLAVGRDLRAVAAIQQRLVDAQQDLERQFWQRRQSEARYRTLFQVASDGVAVLAAEDLGLIEANQAFGLALGLAQPLGAGQPLSGLLPFALRAAVAELLYTARTSGRAGEIRVRAPEGQGALDVAATPFRHGDERLLMLRVRRDEGASVGSPALAVMAEFVETTPDAVVMTDSAGRIQMANPAFLHLAGVATENQALGRSLNDLLGEPDGALSGLMHRANATGIASRVRVRLPAAGQAPRWYEATAVLMTEGEQACLGFTLRPIEPAALAPDALFPDLADIAGRVGQVPLPDLLAEVARRAERLLILLALQRAEGARSVAAELLGVSLSDLSDRLQGHGLTGLEWVGRADDGPPLMN
jgi:transcriptional regulator PpsR